MGFERLTQRGVSIGNIIEKKGEGGKRENGFW